MTNQIKESVQQVSLNERAAHAKETAELIKQQQLKKETNDNNKEQSLER